MAEAKAFKMMPHCTKDTIQYEIDELVQCKDCAYRGNEKKCIVAFVADKQDFPFFFYDNNGTWYCADGKRRLEGGKVDEC